MRVNDIPNVVRGLDPRETSKNANKAGKLPEVDKKSVDGDALDLSLSAKLTAVSATSISASESSESELSPERVAEIRTQITSGYYNKPENLNSLAQRITDFYAR